MITGRHPLALLAAIAAIASCSDDGPSSAITRAGQSVVAVAAQRCENPNQNHGFGVVVAADTVVTAGHTVEGDLRSVDVDGRPAAVDALDRNADLAVLHVDGLDLPAIEFSAAEPDRLVLLEARSTRDVDVGSRERLTIDNVTDHATYHRDVIVFTPGVVEGTSGAPLVDSAGRLAGIVILNDDRTGEGIAVTVGDLDRVLEVANEARTAGLTPC